jgi:hypothetical protein
MAVAPQIVPFFLDAVNKHTAPFVEGYVIATHSSGVGFVLADASNIVYPAMGLIVDPAAVGFVASIQTGGLFALDDWTAIIGATLLSAKTRYFLSTTPGLLVPTPPNGTGNSVQVVGYAQDQNTLHVNIEEPVELA